jgi:hypothetical protein
VVIFLDAGLKFGDSADTLVIDVRTASDSRVSQVVYFRISTVGARHDAEISFNANDKEVKGPNSWALDTKICLTVGSIRAQNGVAGCNTPNPL